MRRMIIVAAVALLVAADALVGSTVCEAQQAAGADPKPEAGSKSDWELHRGATVQRDRIDKFIEKVGSRSVEQLENSLDEEESTVYFAGAMPAGFAAHNVFISVLADRRVAKIYSGYLELDPEQASIRSAALFDKWLIEHERRLQQAVDFYRKRKAYELTIELDKSYYAVTASQFLMSRFCKPAELQIAMERWRKIGNTADAEVRLFGWPYPSDPFNGLCKLDSLIELNLYLACLQANVDDAAFSSIARDDIKIRDESFREIPFSKWDAQTTALDFTHRHKGVPIDESAIITEYRVVDMWEGVHAHRQESREGFVRRARAAVGALESP